MTFTEILQQLGHVYAPREGTFSENNVRHILKVFAPTGDVLPICGDTVQRGIGCPELWSDANCPLCKALTGTVAAITKRSLMLDLVNSLCDAEQMYLDALYWNSNNRDQEALNPDPDGELAKAWIENRAQIISMLDRFRPTMESHESKFGWSDELG